MIPFTTGANPKGITAADLNGDGILDLAVSISGGISSENEVALLLGVGDGSFGSPTTYNTSWEFQVRTFGLVAADVDGDGNRDIVVANQLADTVSVLRGDGAGGVVEIVEVGAPNQPTAVAIADFDGDGRIDVAVTGYSSGNVAVLLGSDAGLIAGAPRQTVFGVVSSTALTDIDLDGKPDLIVARQTAGIFAMRGVGDGTFAAPELLASEFVAKDLIVDDFNADGLPDISYHDGITVVALLQRGDGSFERVATNFSATNDIQVSADLDGDGIPDLIGTQFSNLDIPLRTHRGTGNGKFEFPVITRLTTAVQSGSLAIADFNADGVLDVGLGNFPNTGVVFGAGSGVFGPFVELERGGVRTRTVFAHDFDHDGIPDLAVPGSPITVFRGAATSTFAEQHAIPVLREPLQLDAAIGANGAVALATRFSDGALIYPEIATWQYGTPFFLASGTKSINPGFWVADLNGDGITDIMVRRQSTFIWFVSDP